MTRPWKTFIFVTSPQSVWSEQECGDWADAGNIIVRVQLAERR